jgi:TonB family protein
VVVGAVVFSLAGAGACARNPPPAMPALATSCQTSAPSSQAPVALGQTENAKAQGISGLTFDPQGADFTLWFNRFKDEVYRNWTIPEAALFGTSRGHVAFEFAVERDGTISSLCLLKSSGTPSLDRSAEYALRGSKLLALPNDYGPPHATMQVTFHYSVAPR